MGQKKFQRLTTVWLFSLLLSFGFQLDALAAQTIKAPAITAEAFILMDGDSGEILLSRNAFEKRPPASLTKIMTGLLVIELSDLQSVTTVSEKAAKTGESRINLVENEKITLENLLYSAMLKSANDACVAIGEAIADEESDFVKMMNLKARLLGCVNTQFVNTNGLPDDNHYSCAYDLALIMRYGLQNEQFVQVIGTQYQTIRWESGRSAKIKNTNRLLGQYKGIIGGKTGTTNKAGQCFVAAARREDHTVIAVVLKSQNRFLDAEKLLTYGFKI